MEAFKLAPDEDLKAGDVVRVIGRVVRITKIEPYRGPLQGCIGIARTDLGLDFSLWSGVDTERLVLNSPPPSL